LLTDGEIASAQSSAIVRFDKDGLMTIEEGRLTEIFQNNLRPGDVPVVANNEYFCEGPYKLNAAGRLSVELVCEVKSQQPGVEITIKPFKLEGFVSRTREYVNLTALEGNIQVVEVSVQGRVAQQRQRICTQSLSLGRLRQDGHR
jgi:hypothetical protein